MVHHHIAKTSFSGLKRAILATLMTFTLTSQVWGDGIISHDCLDRQEVFNATTTIHVGASVEPTIAVNPKKPNHIVAVWQQDRISNGGALEAGIAYSWDSGKTWRKSKVPFQICDRGFIQRVSDLWLSYSKDGSKVFLTAFVINATNDINTLNQQGIVVTSSEDGGARWSDPVFLAANQNTANTLNAATGTAPFDDKGSITADPNNKDFAYAVWDRFDTAASFHSSTFISRTTNGGQSFLPHQVLYDPFPDLTAKNKSNGIQNDCSTTNNVVVVLPKVEEGSHEWKHDKWTSHKDKKHRLSGHLLNFMVRQFAIPGATDAQYVADVFPFKFSLFDIALVRSLNHGKSWSTKAKVVKKIQVNQVFTGGYTYSSSGQITGGVGARLRTGANDDTPSYNVNPKNGFLYVVWQTGQFREDKLPQIALSTSRDGGHTWSKAVRVSRTPEHAANPQAFSPFVAVTKDGRVGILYSDLRHDKKLDPNKTKVDTWLAIYQEVKHHEGGSTKVGLEFVEEIRLSDKSFIAQNGPTTDEGLMVTGDYPFLVARGDQFYAIYTKTFKKDFRPVTPFFNDAVNSAVIVLDENYRQAPFVSIIKNIDKKKGGAHLVSTIRMPFHHSKVRAPNKL
jgi:hypothetical protein